MEKKTPSWIIVILVIVGLAFLDSLFNSESTTSNSQVTQPVNSDTLVNCNLGQCGYKQLTSTSCKVAVCCQVGYNYVYTSSNAICTQKQNDYIKSLSNTFKVPTSTKTTTKYCCKVCTTGKACGDSCISRSYTCHKGPGCACNG